MANATCSDKESSTLRESDCSDPNEQQDSSVCDGNSETPLKKRKRMCRYRAEWSGEFSWCKSVRANIFAAECTICQKTFSIAHGGRSDLVKHSLKSCHKTAARAAHASAIQSYFVKATPTGIDRQVVAAELASVYHAVKHHHSYNSADCEMKLNAVIFSDSAVAKKLTCGRTKAEALVTNVLAPKSVELILADLSESANGSLAPNFSISTDASNMKNRKLFPVCVQYFSAEAGIKKKLLDFVELNDEHSAEVADMLVTCLRSNGLDVKNVSAYSADNASVNYGSKKSVFTALKALNGGILKANCNAHIVHNTLRKMTDVLDCDVETIVTAVYSHFSISANRRVELKEFFEFVDLEYHDLLRHVSTRWLSLGPAIQRLLQSWPALISYFRSLGQECPKRVAKSLGLSNTDANDEDDGGIKVNVAKAGLLFVHNLCTLFENTVLALECESVTVCELYPIMQKLRGKLSDRLADRFFGYEATAILQSEDIPHDVRQTVESNFCTALERALSYLEQWFDFSENNIACALQALSLKNMPTFQQINTVAEVLKLSSVLNMDELYDEFSSHKDGLQHVVRGSDGVAVAVKWTRFFQSCGSEIPPNLFHLIAFVLSVPGSNAFPERIFSLMNSKWTCDRNRMSVALVKAELQVFANYTFDCREFYAFALDDRPLLDAAASNSKYHWKNK